jgi:predicted exporter
MLAENAGGALLDAVRAFVARHPPAAFHPDMRVMPAGPVVSALENRAAVEQDVLSVTIACVLIISLAIGLYFRSIRALPLVTAPALLGTAVAFAVAALTFGYLNASTAFLGSIILGNGINHGIVLYARFREERQGGAVAPAAAMTRALDGIWRGTLAAALAAAVAYASLSVTRFRGFSQLGLMGAVGSLACWAVTFALLPALLVRLDVPGRRARAGGKLPSLSGALALALGRPRGATAILAGGALLGVVALLGLGHFLRDPFEYDFRKLSTDLQHDPQHRQFDRNLDALFGRWHTPTVLLADRLDQVEAMRRAIRANDGGARPYIGQIVTVYDLLPGPPAVQARKLALLAEIRKLATDPAVDLLDPDDRRAIHDHLPPADLVPLGPEDLPPLARRPFTEVDGTVGRSVLVYHAEKNVSMWNGRDLLGIARVLESLSLDDGTVIRSSGAPMIFGAMLRSILRDGPLATALALAGVVLVVGLTVRPRRAALAAIGTMLVGVLWMAGAAGLGRVRITFLNFVALPITFGIGIEYAVNLVVRLERERDPVKAVASTGGAVALCSFTTIVGYGSLLAARSQALRGFGTMAILGEIACLAAALLVLPAAAAVLARLSHLKDKPIVTPCRGRCTPAP